MDIPSQDKIFDVWKGPVLTNPKNVGGFLPEQKPLPPNPKRTLSVADDKELYENFDIGIYFYTNFKNKTHTHTNSLLV